MNTTQFKKQYFGVLWDSPSIFLNIINEQILRDRTLAMCAIKK